MSDPLPGLHANVPTVVEVTSLDESEATSLSAFIQKNGPEQVLEALWWLGALMSHLETVDDGSGPKKVRYYTVPPTYSDERTMSPSDEQERAK